MHILLLGSGGRLARDIQACFAADELTARTHEQLDVCDLAAVRAELGRVRPQLVVNTAAFHRVDDCEEQPEQSFAVNAVGVHNLARAAADVGAALVHFSTDYVFDGAKRSPYVETDTPRPQSIYALSKRAGEMILQRYCERYFLIRTCGLYGQPGGRGKGGNFVQTMLRLAREGKPIRVVNDRVLTPTSTADLARKLVPLLHSNHYGLYHMTSTGECSWYEFAREIFRLAGLNPDLRPVSSSEFAAKARRPSYSVLDNAAYRAAGFEDFRPWREALADYFRQSRG